MNIICEAIRERKFLQFYYDGGIRVVEPYAYGYGKNGDLKLRAYQVSGYSSSGQVEGWKLFNAGKITDIQIFNERFSVRAEYNPFGDKHIPNIICKVEVL